MSTSVENYVNRYIKRYHHRIKRICEPLERCFGINYFTYHSISSDGLWRPIVSRPDWADFYTEKQLYLHDPFLQNPECYRSEALLWMHHTNDIYQREILNLAKEKYHLDHGMMIVHKTVESCEFFGFSAPTHVAQIYSTYMNDIELLKKFCLYFKEELSFIVKQVEYDPIDLLVKKGDRFNHISSPFEMVSDSSKTSFLRQIVAHSEQSLSKREKECISIYLDDMRMEDVALKMGLSPRTVECYLNNIKNKLGCDNKSSLLKRARELRSLGIII